MPLVRIDLVAGKSAEYRKTIGDVVYNAMRSALGAPDRDRFEVITEQPVDGFLFDPGYLGIEKTDDCIFIQVTLNEGRTIDQKRLFYKQIADGLHEKLRLRPQDLMINLVEVSKGNWSYGNGEAQYAMP
jgi:4-oxalocrotonate tautomerase